MSYFINCLLVMLFLLPSHLLAEEPAKEQSWWQKRHDRTDIYYPHKAHFKVMDEVGDSCLLCHPFNSNSLLDEKQLKAITVIANEPLAAICHECHTTNISAPYACDLCHDEPSKIWPENHNVDYTNRHAEDSRRDDGGCRTCHLENSFCSECHSQRSVLGRPMHNLGYINQHGLDARIDPAACGACHNRFFCSDCHQESK
jgi:hypothetical protein